MSLTKFIELSSSINLQTINSRFGEILVNLEKKITLPLGAPAIPRNSEFVFAKFPNQKYQNFFIFQSINQKDLSFITLPFNTNEYTQKLIDKEDLEKLSVDLSIPLGDLEVFFITTVKNDVENNFSNIFLNVKAPLIVDIINLTAIQYIFSNDKYQILHKIS